MAKSKYKMILISTLDKFEKKNLLHLIFEKKLLIPNIKKIDITMIDLDTN